MISKINLRCVCVFCVFLVFFVFYFVDVKVILGVYIWRLDLDKLNFFDKMDMVL